MNIKLIDIQFTINYLKKTLAKEVLIYKMQ